MCAGTVPFASGLRRTWVDLLHASSHAPTHTYAKVPDSTHKATHTHLSSREHSGKDGRDHACTALVVVSYTLKEVGDSF